MGRDVIVIGASAGGVESLRSLVASLPADLPASLLVVMHVSPTSPSALRGILGRAGSLAAEPVVDGEPLRHGQIYVAPPDWHLLVRDRHVVLSRGPKENGHRPAVDSLFRSAADDVGPGVVGVILSGNLDDGAAGVTAVAANGGKVMVQDPADALYDGMPRAAMRAVVPDAVVPVAAMGGYLTAWVTENVRDEPPAPATQG